MVLHNPNNWHWVNKDASAWAKSYFDSNLVGISAKGENGVVAEISKVLSVDGDVDVSQRKGKVITLFDVRIQLEFIGQSSSGVDASGTITIPEAAHDTEKEEYVFEVSVYSDSNEKQDVKDLIRANLAPLLRNAIYKFAGDLIEAHGKDIQHTEENDPKNIALPSTVSPSSQTPKPHSVAGDNSSDRILGIASAQAPAVNTTTLIETYEFQATASELYAAFTDPQRVAAFTRSNPRVFEPKVGGKFSLFGGNVEGEFLELNEPRSITQTWRFASWPRGHYSKAVLVFDQGVAVTTLRLTWEKIPIGEDGATKTNFEQYYVQSIKLTFGFGAVL